MPDNSQSGRFLREDHCSQTWRFLLRAQRVLCGSTHELGFQGAHYFCTSCAKEWRFHSRVLSYDSAGHHEGSLAGRCWFRRIVHRTKTPGLSGSSNLQWKGLPYYSQGWREVAIQMGWREESLGAPIPVQSSTAKS